MIDFLCIGVQKAGTTWLMANIKHHPQVWTPPFVKELHYFDVRYLGYSKEERLKKFKKRCERIIVKKPNLRSYCAKVLDETFAFTDDWYRHVFSIAKSGKLKAECTPLYFALERKGIEHVRRMLAPQGKLIVMMRDPVARALSSLRMEMEWVRSPNAEQIMREPLFDRRGDYATNIPRWEAVFAPEDILYVPFGRIKHEPHEVIREIEAYLGLSRFSEYPKLSTQVNATKKDSVFISDDIVERIKNISARQYEFLNDRFGADFVEMMK